MPAGLSWTKPFSIRMTSRRVDDASMSRVVPVTRNIITRKHPMPLSLTNSRISVIHTWGRFLYSVLRNRKFTTCSITRLRTRCSRIILYPSQLHRLIPSLNINNVSHLPRHPSSAWQFPKLPSLRACSPTVPGKTLHWCITLQEKKIAACVGPAKLISFPP